MTMSETRLKSSTSSKSLIAIALLSAIIGFGLLAWGQQTDSLPIVITGCIISLLAAVMFMVIVYSFHDLEDRAQALGLPEGSVRALMALMLLVIFAVFASAFFSKLSETGGAVTDTSGAPSATGTDASGTAGTAATTDTTGTTQTSGTTGTTTTTDTTGTPPAPATTGTAAANTSTAATNIGPAASSSGAPPTTVSVTPSNLDFARQIIAIIGTLLTAVISFYFGSRSSATTTSEPAPRSGPALVISPKATSRGSSARFEISGFDAASVKSAVLKRDGNVIEGTTLERMPANRLGVTFTVSSEAATGSWDLIVELADGRKASLTDAITVT